MDDESTGAQHWKILLTSYERALALMVDPGVEVIGDEHRCKPGLLCCDGLVEEVRWSVLLTG
jgi:hypothetical protein